MRATIRTAVVTLVIGALLAGGGALANASVATKANPCKLLKASEIKAQLGGDVTGPTKGLVTPVSNHCRWGASADADRPEGEVVVGLQFVGAKIAFNTAKKEPSNESVSGLGKAFYVPSLSVVWVLKGSTLLTVQGVFIGIGNTGIDKFDAKDQLVALAKKARSRL